MATPKKYFHDRLILLLLSIGAFLALANSLAIFLRLDFGSSQTYTIQYRDKDQVSAVDRFSGGTVQDLLVFALFALVVFGFHFYLSRKGYSIRRHYAVAILGLGILLQVFVFIVVDLLITAS